MQVVNRALYEATYASGGLSPASSSLVFVSSAPRAAFSPTYPCSSVVPRLRHLRELNSPYR